MIENLEANLTGAPIDYSNPDDLLVAEESSSDEAITAVDKANNEIYIDIEEEHKTKAYQETMNIYIENIEKIEKRHKNYTKQLRKI